MGKLDLAFWKEFFDALYPDYHYKNIKSPLLLVNMNYILLGLYVGVVLGLIATYYRRAHLGKAIRAIISAEAFSPETAKTPEELGIGKSRILKRALKKSKFGGMVKAAIADSGQDSLGETRYYIPEKIRFQAEDRYSKKGAGIGKVILWAIIMIPVFLVLRYVIPEFLLILDGILGS